MLIKKSIQDVMVDIEEYPHIPSDISLKKAISVVKNSMLEAKNCFQPMIALVFDDRGLVGTLRLRDILKGLEPGFLKPSKKVQGYSDDAAGLSIIWDTLFDTDAKERVEKPVNEVMNPITVFVEPGDTVVKAAYLMIHNDLLVIPVLEEGKKLKGLVRMIEVFDVLTDRVLED